MTEVKNGTVMQAPGNSIIVRTDDGIKMFTQSDIDKRGVKIMREGKPADISDFRANDRLTATIVTTKPPRVMTEKEVQATLAQERWRCGGTPAAAAPPAASTPPAAPAPSAGRGDLGRCAEEAAQDGQPPAVAWAHGLRFAPRGVGPHRQASSRDAQRSPIRRAARHRWPARAMSSAACSSVVPVYLAVLLLPRSMK